MKNFISIDLLPKRNNENINWSKCLNIKLDFYFNGIYGDITIIKPVDQYRALILYDEKEYIIGKSSLLHCRLSEVIKINKPFLYNIGETFEDSGRNLSILEMEYRKRESSTKNEIVKWYRCKCLRCNTNEAWINEYHLKEGRGCPVCHGKRVSIGINDIPTTAPWMIPYFQGGYDEAKLYTKSSNQKIVPICPDCGTLGIKSIPINYIYVKHTISCTCSDGISYSEKFIISVLGQMNIKFQPQLAKSNFSWCNKYKYDFYIPSINCIIEVHGAQHYKSCSWGDYKEVHKNDEEKKRLALQNNIQTYIELDCRKSELKWIKKSIMQSIMPRILHFTESDIDWKTCEENSYKNIIKEVCDFKNKNPKLTATEMTPFFNVDRSTICKYLHKGEKLGWCTYSGYYKYVEVFKDDVSLGKFKSAKDLSESSIESFGVYFHPELIKRVCRKDIDLYKGYFFEYVYDLNVA